LRILEFLEQLARPGTNWATYALQVTSTAPSTTAPVSAPSSLAPGGVAEWVIALVSAVIGALLGGGLTIGADEWRQWRTDKSRFTDLRAFLVDEVAAIFKESEERAAVHPLQPRLRGPLPTAAWSALNLSGLAHRLGTSRWRQLAELYREIESVNYQAAQALSLLQTAAISKEEGFRADAQRLLQEPYVALLARRGPVMAALGLQAAPTSSVS